jgi:uncharacterized protein (DUF488 family)
MPHRRSQFKNARMAHPIFTIGHSTRPLADFLGILRQSNIERVIDVRSMPRSRTNPQFNRHVLAETLAQASIGYEHVAALGGLRGRNPDVPPDVNAFWQNSSFHNYADYAMSEAFRTGLAGLRRSARQERCAIMCAEAVWWRCHRRIIADYLLHEGEAVFHIVDEQRVEPARMTDAARPRPDGVLVYPAMSVEPPGLTAPPA